MLTLTYYYFLYFIISYFLYTLDIISDRSSRARKSYTYKHIDYIQAGERTAVYQQTTVFITYILIGYGCSGGGDINNYNSIHIHNTYITPACSGAQDILACQPSNLGTKSFVFCYSNDLD